MSVLRFDSPNIVPVEVFDNDLILRASTVSNEKVELPPGRYYVTARLATGGQRSVTVELVETGAVASLRSPRRPRSVGSTVPKLESRPADSDIAKAKRELEQWLAASLVDEPGERPHVQRTGNAVSGHWALLVDSTRNDGALTELRLKTELEHQHSFVPAGAIRYLTPAVRIDEHGFPRLATRLRKRSAEQLMRFLNRGQLLDAAVISSEVIGQAESALSAKRGDPLAAAAGACTLLRLGRLDRLHDWTENLYNWFRWLPDATVVSAEHLARVGRHEQALDRLCRLGERDLPCLTVALTLAVERFDRYAGAGLSNERAKVLRERLDRYAVACDLETSIVSFRGDFDAPCPRGTRTTHPLVG